MSDEILSGSQENLDLMQRRRDGAPTDELFSSEFVDRDPAVGQPAGGDGLAWYWDDFGKAFDFERQILHTVATPEHVITVTQLSGTHTGEWQGHPATGRRFSVRSVQVMRMADGRIVERWGSTDQLGILQQLGLS